MKLNGDFMEFSEQMRDLEEQLQQYNSNLEQTAQTLARISREQKAAARLACQDLINTADRAQEIVEMHASAMENARKSIPSQSVIRQTQETLQAYNNPLYNENFLQAVNQHQELAETVQSLQEIAAEHQARNPDPFQYPPYDATYEPIRRKAFGTATLLGQFLLASLMDQGELSDDLGEVEKQHIRNALATLIGIAAGLITGLVFVLSAGAPVIFAAGGASAHTMNQYYNVSQETSDEE